MKRLLIALLIVAAVPALAAERSFDFTRPGEGIVGVTVQAGVGEVEVIGDGGAGITARVEVTSKRGSFWSSHRSREIDALELGSEVRGNTLHLRISPDDRDGRDFIESWTVHVPSRLAAEVKLGVGDVRLLDVTGDLTVSAGVGDIRIESSYAMFGSIQASCGVGDATLRTPEGRDEGEGFIAHELHGKGPGSSTIRVSAGVGDVTIRLR